MDPTDGGSLTKIILGIAGAGGNGILLLTNAEEALVDDPDTIAFVGYVQQQGYITAERAVEILKA